MADAEDQRHGNVSLSGLALKKVGHGPEETKPKHPSKKKEWKPWKDRLADHADTVLFIQAFLDPLQDSEFTRQNVMTVSADGVVTVYHLHLATSNPTRHGGFRLGQVANIESITCLTSDTAPVSAAWCNSRTIETPPPPSVLYGGHVNGKVSAWSADGALLVELLGHTGAITAIRSLSTLDRLSENGDDSDEPDLATASMDASIRIWRVAVLTEGSAACLFILDLGLRNPVSDLVLLSPQELVASTWDGQVRFISLTERACSKALQVVMGQVRSICRWRKKAEDDWQIFAGTDEGNISCWTSGSFPGLTPNLPGAVGVLHQRLSWQGHWGHVISLNTCKDWLISSAEDKLIRIWDTFSGRLIVELWGHSAGVISTSVAWPLLWTGSRDHTVRSWDLGEIDRQIQETAAMELCDAQSFQYEVTFSRLTLKQLKKLAAEKKAATKGDPKQRGSARGRRQ